MMSVSSCLRDSRAMLFKSSITSIHELFHVNIYEIIHGKKKLQRTLPCPDKYIFLLLSSHSA